MNKCGHIVVFLAIFLFGCSGGGGQFASYEREYLGKAAIGGSVTKQIVLRNASLTEVEHITGLNFNAGNNTAGHFRIDKVEVGGVVQNPRDKDISIPAGSILQIYVTYQPLNLETTIADFGGWETGVQERYVPQKPSTDDDGAIKAMGSLLGKSEDASESAIHRAILAVVYDFPRMGVVQFELVGEAVPGVNGETSAAGGSKGECPEEGGALCYTGGFAIDLPDIMTTGPKLLQLMGPVVFQAAGSSVTLDMSTFPSAFLVLKGNGPGEPLEGKPIGAISIVISGSEGIKANGTFDGSNLELNGVTFRIRVILGEISEEDITPGLQAAVDFNITDLTMKTSKPYTNGSITLIVEATLAKEPSKNPMFDQFLGGTRVNVTMDGTLSGF